MVQTLEVDRPPTPHRVTVDEYQRMGDAGVFAPDVRVELIEGEVIDMAPIGNRHATAVRRLSKLLFDALGARAVVSVQNPLRLGSDSQPQPDLAVLQARGDFYAAGMPTARDALLVIEVSDTSARFDREIKLPLYSRHGVPEVWIVDLDSRLVRFFRGPLGDGWAVALESASPGPTPLAALPQVSIDLTGVLG